ncbi:MAG TPA: DUF3656 domain-containing protein [Candidatus Eremiobacteraeota bacterium]|nr:MAG: Collagenase [bacterium ADurb.Bin363]HPZ07580.1 DUF3656 domain-containing protein [Candidatus Eremiobacteraeota bacterium]
MKENRIFPDNMDFIRKGTLIYRNLDLDFLKKIKKAKIQRKISLSLSLFEEDNHLVFQTIDEDGVKALINSEINKEIAIDTERALNNIKKQITSLEETEFSSSELII